MCTLWLFDYWLMQPKITAVSNYYFLFFYFYLLSRVGYDSPTRSSSAKVLPPIRRQAASFCTLTPPPKLSGSRKVSRRSPATTPPPQASSSLSRNFTHGVRSRAKEKISSLRKVEAVETVSSNQSGRQITYSDYEFSGDSSSASSGSTTLVGSGSPGTGRSRSSVPRGGARGFQNASPPEVNIASSPIEISSDEDAPSNRMPSPPPPTRRARPPVRPRSYDPYHDDPDFEFGNSFDRPLEFKDL